MAQYEFVQLTEKTLEGYVRRDVENRRAVVFVHGFGGDIRTTWEGKVQGKLFQELLSQDDELADFNFLSFGYQSGVMGGASVVNLAQQLKNAINQHLEGMQIVLVAHSLGGIVCMQYIIKLLEKGEGLPVIGLVMYGTPTNGTELIKTAELLSWGIDFKLPGAGRIARWFIKRNKQMQELAAHSELLQDLHGNWVFRVANGGNSAETDTKRRAFMNVRVITGNEDWVVKEHSAKGLYGEIDWHPLNFDHISLVKPDSQTDARFLALKGFLVQSLTWLEPTRLSRIKHYSEELWAMRSAISISKWDFIAELFPHEPFNHAALAAAGYATTRVSCNYRRTLTSNSLVIGMSIGQAGRKKVWEESPEPFYVHQLLVDLLPQTLRGTLTGAVLSELGSGTPEAQWRRFFPEISVCINNVPMLESHVSPNGGSPNVGYLRRTYNLREEQSSLIGKEVEFSLNYCSAVPKALSSYNVFSPWLVDQFSATVKVNDDLKTFVPIWNYPTGMSFNVFLEPDNPKYRLINVSSKDLVTLNSGFNIFWA